MIEAKPGVEYSGERLRFGVIADDLTGATDTGLQCARCGIPTRVWLDRVPDGVGAAPGGSIAAVVDLDSRVRPPAEARDLARVAAADFVRLGFDQVYKKIDSTMRGNVGAEVEGALAGSGAPVALVCPAFPANGRTVVDGRLHVRGVALAESEFARDPLWPATSSDVTVLVARQTNLPIGRIGLDVVRGGSTRVLEAGEHVRRAGGRLLVADAEQDNDLRALAGAAIRDGWLPVGSAGLAESVARERAGSDEDPAGDTALSPPRIVPDQPGPILAIVGSISPTARRQVGRLCEQLGVLHLELPLDGVLAERSPYVDAGVPRAAVAALKRGNTVVIDLAVDGDDRLVLEARVTELGRVELARRLTRRLGDLARDVVGRVRPAGFVLTGGDTARAVCGALDVAALDVVRQVAPGIPLCRLAGGPADGRPVVTKAGGFGEGDALLRAVLAVHAATWES